MTPVAPIGPAPLHHAAPLPPFDLVIFGGSGDLALRKLLPALFHRYRDGQIVDGTRIVGVARDARSDDDYREQVRTALAAEADKETGGAAALADSLARDLAGRVALELVEASGDRLRLKARVPAAEGDAVEVGDAAGGGA